VQEDNPVSGDLTKADKKKVRQLAGIAWERELRCELRKIAAAIEDMENNSLSAFDVNDSIHRFHNGASRELFKRYSDSLPWWGVCRAYFDGVLTDEDLADAIDEVRNGVRELAASFAKLDTERGAAEEVDHEDL
jgi:hypothetical protein